jgi:hypothetical protein
VEKEKWQKFFALTNKGFQHFMRIITFIILLFSFSVSFGQSLMEQKSTIDAAVEAIDTDKANAAFNFNITSTKKVFHKIYYQYQSRQGSIVKIERRFKLHNDSTIQTFYFKNAQLIYATELITSYYGEKNKPDSMVWGGNYYFSKNKLIDFITLGHGKSETDEWNPQQEVLANCKVARNDIAKHKKK